MPANPFEPKPAPLTEQECARIWRWERGMLIYYTVAMLLLGAVSLAAAWYGGTSQVRLTLLGVIVALVVAGAFVQFRERCPRCAARLGRQSRLVLPNKCRSCGVEFPRPSAEGRTVGL